MKFKLKPIEPKPFILHVREGRSGLDDEMRRYLLPLPEDLPLLRDHHEGEWFQRIDGCSVCQRWKDPTTGQDFNRLIFYPAPGMQEILERNANDWTRRDDFLLLLWRMLQKFGSVDYDAIPGDVKFGEYDKYLNRSMPKLKLKLKPKLKLKLKEAV